MKEFLSFAHGSLLVFILLGCVTTDQYVGKSLPDNYYVCNCESFPAEGLQKNKDLEIDYQVSKMENGKYRLTGEVRPVFGGTLTRSEYADLSFLFFLVKDNFIVHSVKITTAGDADSNLKFNKEFMSEANFNGITVGKLTGRIWGN